MIYQFSDAITSNIERTYTFAHAKGAHNYSGAPDDYSPISFFHECLEKEPFDTFMELERFGFKKTLKTLQR